MSERAVFLDRDGTLTHPRHYPARPEELCLYTGIAPGLRRLAVAGFRLIVVTNQSGIARGLFTEADLQGMHEYLANELAHHDVTIDAFYHCPHHPDGVVPDLAVVCACRKPQPGMLLRAAADLGLDLRRSWFVGDVLDDIEAGNRVGCRTVLVDLGSEARPTQPLRTPAFAARDTIHALALIAACEQLGPAAELTYCPTAWLQEHMV